MGLAKIISFIARRQSVAACLIGCVVLSANATAAEDLGARTAFAVNLAATRLGVDSSTIITR